VTFHEHDVSHDKSNSSAESLRELDYLEQFEDLIINLSGRFVNVVSRDLDHEINHALEAIGLFARVDRSYVFQFSADGKRFTNTHEWCATGVEPMMNRLQNASADHFRWALQHFTEGEELYIEDVAELPEDADNVKEELVVQGIRALVNVPLLCDGRVIGFVGFDAMKKPKIWTKKHRNLLKVVGEIIASAIERERKTAALSHQLELEKLVADISAHFINVPISELESEIDRTIQRIGKFTEVDRSYVFRFSEDGLRMTNTHEWCARGIEPHIDRLQDYPVGEFEFSMSRLRKGEVFHVPDVSELPKEAEREREEFENEGIQTLVNVPIMARQKMIGFLGFDAVTACKSWTENDIRLLKLIAEIIANALDRRTTEEQLQNSLRDKEVLLKEIHHRVKNNMQIVNSLLYLQEQAVKDRVDSLALDALQQSRSRIKAMAAIHDRLYRSGDFASIDFDEYLRSLIPDLLDSYRMDKIVDVELSASGIKLGLDAAIPCSLIINELVTNSLKHAFPARQHGKIRIMMSHALDDAIALVVSDDGVGLPENEAPNGSRKSLGLRLVSDLARQLDGTVSYVRRQGAEFHVEFSRIE
jgi:two-component sensor histidine kinase/putative methionine-R-sulfoxide reductase with GAF domain